MAVPVPRLHVVCYNWGTKYGPTYVNRLRAMVARNLSVEHTFHCVSDSSEGFSSDVVMHELPDLGVPGVWRKLMTFQPDFLGLAGEFVLIVDLDVVIVDNLDFVASNPQHDFVIARNWPRGRDRTRGSGCLYRLRIGSHVHVWDRFYTNIEAAIDQYYHHNRDFGEQNWLDANISDFNYFAEWKVVSFKRHCNSRSKSFCGRMGRQLGLTTALFSTAHVPEGAALVSFHGDPLPSDVRDGPYKCWKRAPFVAAHWRE